MAIERKFQIGLLLPGGISYIYHIHPRIVVKIPQNDDFAREQFCKELEIYKLLSRQAACEFFVQCFHYTNEGIFLEYMRDGSLHSRMQENYTYDRSTYLVTHVNKLEPLHLRLAWMDELAQAIAFLESLNLAHGDLRPDNILIDHRNRIKVTDFDNTAEFGTPFWALQPPWGREVTKNEPGYDIPGCLGGLLGPRTEQFALGSIYYYINYGMEVYGDMTLNALPRDRGLALSDLLRDMKFPVLVGDAMISKLIHQCWHNQFPTIASLAMSTKALLNESFSGEEHKPINEGMDVTLETQGGSLGSDGPTSMGISDLPGMDMSEEELCRKFDREGLFDSLRSRHSH